MKPRTVLQTAEKPTTSSIDQWSESLSAKNLDSAVLTKLSDLAADYTGIRFFVVFPQANGWGQLCPRENLARPEFCKLIHKTKAGAAHCRMCHILMSVAACSKGLTEQRCHARVSVLSTPVEKSSEDAMAILSTCLCIGSNGTDGWKESRARGKKLGIDLKKLKKAYDQLPQLTEDQSKRLRAIMAIAAEAVKESKTRFLVTRELTELRGQQRSSTRIQTAVEHELKSVLLSLPPRLSDPMRKQKNKKSGDVPVAIEVISNLVSRKPQMPFTVSEIAAAARITPNHFSTLFHRHKGESFSEFLAEKRMAIAKSLLSDLTLNIGEVARRSGYEDSGYFSRLFKQKTGFAPREWRSSLKPEQL